MMKKPFIVLIAFILQSCLNIEKEFVIDKYHGRKMKDYHRHLEDLENTKVINLVKNQNLKTESILSKIPSKKRLINKLEIYDRKRSYVISKLFITANNRIFYLKRNSGENVSNLYYRKNLIDKEIKLFDLKDLDPQSNKEYQINYIKPNWDGSKVVVNLIKDEDEYSKMIILDVNTRKMLPHSIDHCKPNSVGGVQWLPNNNSFYYSYFPNASEKNKNSNLNSKAIVYRLDTNPENLNVVLSKEYNPDISIKPEDFPIVEITDTNAKYAVGVISGSSPYDDSYYIPIDQLYQNKTKWIPLFKKTHRIKDYIVHGENIFFLTANNAPNFKICKTSMDSKNFDDPEVLVPEKKEEIIKYFVVTKKGLFFTTVINGVRAKLYRLHDGRQIEILLPKPSADIKLYTHGNNVMIATKGWLSKTKRYLFNFETETLDEYNLFSDNNTDDFDDLVVEELTVPSHDGKEVPLSLIYKKGTKKDGNTPVLIRGYGAYGVPMVPNPYYPFLLYAREGGIYAVAHVRGGGEKGNAWYKGGHKATKPNTWKDFIACTEYLIDKKYTSKGKIAVWSGSAGGILIGRAITERPDLFAAAIIDRGILNTIRMEEGINGANSAKEFGTVNDSIEFKGLLEMDSYHHIKKNTHYPATFIRTGMNDTRVSPWQSIKFATRLQEANSSDHPILLKTEFDSGHGIQFSKNKEFNMIAEAISFALWQTSHPDYQPKEE